MSCGFYIVDDDRSVRKMLMQIIHTHFEGASVFQNDSPYFSIQEILRFQPDLVILDLLMDEMDGIEVADQLRKNLYKGHIIMLSEVTDKDMVEKAYVSGVNDYISKPINVTEVVNVLKRNIESLQLKNYVRLVGTPQSNNELKSTPLIEQQLRQKASNIFKDLGIVGEPGTEELVYYAVFAKVNRNQSEDIGNLAALYQWLKDSYPPYASDSISIKGIEQRLRRLVLTVTENLAHMGIEDFSSYRFERYSSALFNFKTVKQEMDFIRKRSEVRGKADVKRFIDGFLSLLE